MEMASSELPGSVLCIRLNGRMDAEGANRIDVPFTASVAVGGRSAAIDLTDVTFIASMGIRLLISAARGVRMKGSKMVLFGARPLVQDVLEQAAIDQIIPLVATQEQALELLAR
jgi:anti-anti-sigma factor